ncbi:putative porin [Microbulbifer sp. TRSA005]|uniref:putative porin n=1 Tax=unclassified Microbulbifer TaxID=2619833 RepID=UPI004039215C
MKKYGFIFLFVFFVALDVVAEEYNSITNFGYSDLDFDEGDRDEFFAETTYYFSVKSSLGPFNEFEFINKASSLSAAYFHSAKGYGNSDDFALGGEFFSKAGFVFGGNLTTFGRDNFNTFSLGYLFTSNFLMKIYNTDGATYAKARYNYQLNDSDYVGFDVSTDIVFDWQIFSSKYFSKIGGDKYVSLEFNYLNDNEWDNYWRAAANYYFTKNSSLGVDYDENSDYRVGFSHFLNKNVAIKASYTTILENTFRYTSFGSDVFKTIWNTDRNLDKFELGVTVQF